VTRETPARQVAALPFRKRRGKIEILLITSRETKRWVIPKGWPMPGLMDFSAAKREAFEEAGVEGRACKIPIGEFAYDKRLKSGDVRTCLVRVFLLNVQALHASWPEKHQRRRAWFTPEKASELVHEKGLKSLILSMTQTRDMRRQ
jgi:8-oxo-dGTP pyrophosphatase MutT (NUDIX family)